MIFKELRLELLSSKRAFVGPQPGNLPECLREISDRNEPINNPPHPWDRIRTIFSTVVIFITLPLVAVFTQSCTKNTISPTLDTAQSHLTRGLEFSNNGELTNAIQAYDQAIKLDPNFAEAYNSRGLAYYGQGDIALALQDWEVAIQLKPDFVLAYINRANAYADQGELDLAINDFDHAIQIDPGAAEAYHNRGMVYAIKGEPDRAIDDYDKAIQINPSIAVAYYNRGATLANIGETAEAIADFKIVLERCGSNAQLCDQARQLLQQLGGQ